MSSNTWLWFFRLYLVVIGFIGLAVIVGMTVDSAVGWVL
jgi:hypothetical protein